jgi:hypothetical protein
MPSGYTMLGQFIAHDLTYDPTPLDPSVEVPEENLRTTRLDLDSLYGDSPVTGETAPRVGAKMLIAVAVDETTVDDLPRTGNQARIADPRNDANLLICQLHLAFLKLHNAFAKQVRDTSLALTDDEVFAKAKTLTQCGKKANGEGSVYQRSD